MNSRKTLFLAPWWSRLLSLHGWELRVGAGIFFTLKHLISLKTYTRIIRKPTLELWALRKTQHNTTHTQDFAEISLHFGSRVRTKSCMSPAQRELRFPHLVLQPLSKLEAGLSAWEPLRWVITQTWSPWCFWRPDQGSLYYLEFILYDLHRYIVNWVMPITPGSENSSGLGVGTVSSPSAEKSCPF